MGTGPSNKSRSTLGIRWGEVAGSVLALAFSLLSVQREGLAQPGGTVTPTGTGKTRGGTKGSSGRDAGTADGRTEKDGKNSSTAAGTSRGG
jgi:hypothetical protein